jgi:hypothetical protein
MMEDLKKLLKKKFNQDFLVEESETETYHVSRPLNTAVILDIYKNRYKLYQERNCKDDNDYEDLIKGLEAFAESKLLLHRFQVEKKYIICFTDLNLKELIGVLETEFDRDND